MSKETYETIAELAPSYAGAIMKGTEAVLKFLGYWTDRSGSETDRALALMQAQINLINQQLEEINTRLNDVSRRIAQLENGGRLDKLRNYLRDAKGYANRLEHHPADVGVRQSLAFDAAQLVDEFVSDTDLWRWTDVQTRTPVDHDGHPGQPVVTALAPEFRSYVALPVYSLAVMTWLSAVDFYCNGNFQMVQAEHGERLRRHIAFIESRPGWVEGQQPVTLPEQIRSRITCYPQANTKYAQDDECTFTILCRNDMLRRVTPIREVVQAMPPGVNVLCTTSPDIAVFDERDVEDREGVQLLAHLEEALRRMERSGTLRGEYIGRFDTTPFYNNAWVYTVTTDGQLLWFHQKPSTTPTELTGWQGPAVVGSGWDQFSIVLPAGGNCFYGVLPDGTLRWYQHVGFNAGTMEWNGAKTVGSGWNQFARIVPGSDGVLYAIDHDGNLRWYRHDAYTAGDASTWRGPRQVGTGWGGFVAVFSSGEGILYGIRPDGTLLWYRHKGFVDGSNAWDGPVQVGTGWQDFTSVFSVGEGVIYAIAPDGRMRWYRHKAWNTDGLFAPPDPPRPPPGTLARALEGPHLHIGGGEVTDSRTHINGHSTSHIAELLAKAWAGPLAAGDGWTSYRQVFGLMVATPSPVH
jgi:hypothetical protein